MFPTLSYSPFVSSVVPKEIKTSFIFKIGRYFSYHLFGITNHPVFMDGHYKDSNYVWKLVDPETGQSDVLVDSNGSPNFEMSGRVWVRF